jgi:RNA polymerase sigma factor (sigma-70 family)
MNMPRLKKKIGLTSDSSSLSEGNLAEQRLWQCFLIGDVSAFDALMTMYYRPLFRYGSRFSHDKEFIKDCIQDLFLYLWERRNSLQVDVSPKPYLMASLRRYMHRNLPNTVFSDEFTDDKVQIFNFEFSVEERFIGQETILTRTRHLKQLLETLPPRQKEVIYLKFFQEMEREQIAEMMDIAPQTVSNLIQLALKQLRQYWKLELLTFVLLNLSLL